MFQLCLQRTNKSVESSESTSACQCVELSFFGTKSSPRGFYYSFRGQLINPIEVDNVEAPPYPMKRQKIPYSWIVGQQEFPYREGPEMAPNSTSAAYGLATNSLSTAHGTAKNPLLRSHRTPTISIFGGYGLAQNSPSAVYTNKFHVYCQWNSKKSHIPNPRNGKIFHFQSQWIGKKHRFLKLWNGKNFHMQCRWIGKKYYIHHPITTQSVEGETNVL